MIHPKYSTTNITLATTLSAMNFELDYVTLTGRNGTQGMFHYVNVPKNIIDQFDQGIVRVDPQIWHTWLKRLSAMAKGVANG